MAAANPAVWVSIVHWNGGDSTLHAIESVVAQDYAPLRVVVVDNASTDGALETALARWPQVTVLRNRENLGFTGGHNQGVDHALKAGAEFVLLLNQDAALLPDCVERMVERFRREDRVGLVSPVLYYSENPSEVQFSGSWVDWNALEIKSSFAFDEIEARSSRGVDTMCLWGTALMVSRAFVAEVGMFDEGLFAYFEDLDLSVRAARAGWKARMCFDAGVLHEGHHGWRARGPHYFYFMNRNEIAFWRKHVEPARRSQVWREAIARTCGTIGNLRDAGKPVHAEACLLALRDAWVGRVGGFDPARRGPRLLRAAIWPHPFLVAHLARFGLRGLLGELTSRLRNR